jgi:4-hydroxythreonine-4-phosphate dehydrogenase
MSARKRPCIAISVGDPGGIGPEITAKALASRELYRLCRPLVVAEQGLMREAVRIARVALRVNAVQEPEAGLYRFGTLDVLDLGNFELSALRYGEVTAAQGKASFEFIRKVIELAMAGKAAAAVTGPIHKEAINKAGYRYSGHTEIFAELTGTRDYAMMLADGDFRVVHVTTHASLRQAIAGVKSGRVLKVIHLAQEALRRSGIAWPRIGVAGLNPHAGEGGLFGTEEIDEILPAVRQAQAEGLAVEGPLPADTIFVKMRGGLYDAVVAMYHDQGHIPTKLVGFSLDKKSRRWLAMAGVNVTLGLPIVRTSVDHGVAFGKAGSGKANPQSLIEAIRLAVRLCEGGKQ